MPVRQTEVELVDAADAKSDIVPEIALFRSNTAPLLVILPRRHSFRAHAFLSALN
jgi:hypothetical protein